MEERFWKLGKISRDRSSESAATIFRTWIRASKQSRTGTVQVRTGTVRACAGELPKGPMKSMGANKRVFQVQIARNS